MENSFRNPIHAARIAVFVPAFAKNGAKTGQAQAAA
jgi:hypothetical protein